MFTMLVFCDVVLKSNYHLKKGQIYVYILDIRRSLIKNIHNTIVINEI